MHGKGSVGFELSGRELAVKSPVMKPSSGLSELSIRGHFTSSPHDAAESSIPSACSSPRGALSSLG